MASTRTERTVKAARLRFTTLITDLHARMGLPPPGAWPPADAPSAAAELEWRQVRFRFAHDAEVDRTLLVVQCFYGPALPCRAPEILARLLELNHVLAIRRAGATFGMDADSAEAVYVFTGLLSDVTGASLFSAVELAACHALHWRATFLLGDPFAATSAGVEVTHAIHV
jgi:hypothetical protein